MKALSTFLFLLLNLGLLSPYTKAQTKDFNLLKNKKSVTIPFQFINKNIIIPLSINDSDSLYFMLDSGLTNTLITELFPEDSLQLNNTDREVIKGLGGHETLSVVISYNNQIQLKGITGNNQRINLLEEDIFKLSQLAGHKINGIIGYNILKDFIVKIDYVNQLLTLYNPKRYKKKLRNFLHFPIEIVAGKPYIRTTIVAPDNQKKTLKLMIDTGASLSLWLMDNNKIHIPKPKKTISTYLGQGLSGKIHGEYGRIPYLFFKEKVLPNVLTAYPDAEDVQGAILEGRNGSIGSEILRRFHVVIDYPNKRLSLKANKFFRENFDFNLSGIEVYQPDIKIPFYKVYALRANSPLENAGLRIDDILLEINGQSTLTMSLDKVIKTIEKLETRKNKKIELLIKREESLLNIVYTIPNETLI